MKRKISTGLADFKEVIANNNLYVDKSEFISEIIDMESKVTAVARPRRFGKTLNMSMLSYFFDINNNGENRKLFKGLKVEKSLHFAEQGCYPVISITFKDVKSDNWEESYEDIVSQVVAEYWRHSYLQQSTKLDKFEKENFEKILRREAGKSEYKNSLKDLSGYLSKHHGRRVVILIDEFDTPVIEGELEGYFKKASKFMQGFLGGALKENKSLYKGVVTGITKLQGAGIFSGVNNADIFTIFDGEYRDKFGFTEKEVKDLLKEYDMDDKEEAVRDYYNGYNFDGEVIYNPYSVVKYIKKRKFGNFWLGSSDNDLARKKIQDLLELKGDEATRKIMEDLLQGKKVTMKVKEALKISDDMATKDILNLLLYSGYLKYENIRDNESKKDYMEVSIPNLEIKAVYDQSIEEWIEKDYKIEEIEDIKQFLESVCEGDESEIKRKLERYLGRRSIFDGERVLEMGYHNFLFGLLQGLENRYILDSNRESGVGRFDIMLTPKVVNKGGNSEQKGVIIELKVGDKGKLKILSKEALKQIEEKKYYKNLEEQGLTDARLIGIAFNKKEAEVTLREINLVK